jgi:hypothetical protein
LYELQREAYSRHQHNSGKPISTISWLAYRCQLFAAEAPFNKISHIQYFGFSRCNRFLLFKEQVPLKFKKEIPAVQCERKTFRLISLSTPVSFRWTVPLSG